MKAQGTTLYPFVPSGPNFTMSIAFFAELGFDKVWQHDGLAGLRFGGAYFMLQRPRRGLLARKAGKPVACPERGQRVVTPEGAVCA